MSPSLRGIYRDPQVMSSTLIEGNILFAFYILSLHPFFFFASQNTLVDPSLHPISISKLHIYKLIRFTESQVLAST